MSGTQGRFQSPDPGNAGAQLGDPQTWNGYSYVANNPLTYTDPSGLGFWSTLWNGTIWIGEHVLPALATKGVNQLWGGGWPGIGGSGGPWSEQLPAGVGIGGTLNTGTVFGSGNTAGPIFSYNPEVHEGMTFEAARLAGLDPNLALFFATGVADVDKGTQGLSPAMTHIHAMGGRIGWWKFETCAQAYAGTQSELDTDMKAAVKGDNTAKFRALHTIQDSYSAAHQYAPWKGVNYGPSHYKADAAWSNGPVAASRAFLEALEGKSPMGKATDYLYRPSSSCK
jgi:hypothetical protein